MPANTQPIFGLTPNVTKARLSTANTTRDLGTTTNAVLIFTPGADGSKIERITFTDTANNNGAASISTVLRIYLTDAAIANPRLYKEFSIASVTSSSTAVGATITYNIPGGIFLPSGMLVYATTSVTSGWDIITEGYDY